MVLNGLTSHGVMGGVFVKSWLMDGEDKRRVGYWRFGVKELRSVDIKER